MNETKSENHGRAANQLPCHLTITSHTIDNATALAAHIKAKFTAHEFVGIVWTTNGTRRVPDVKSSSFDDSRTYEIRLWQVIGSDNADSMLAHEFRWVSGVGAVELTLTSGRPRTSSEVTESVSVSGWFHKVSYLQHKSAATSKEESAPDTGTRQTKQGKRDSPTNDMSALEFIQEEDKYGNTVVVDQLFTGRWS